ncbi:MAG: HAMP domain-containing sensor histidine kinase [Thermoleophilia bacterium]
MSGDLETAGTTMFTSGQSGVGVAAVPRTRRGWATFGLAGVIAAVACAVPLTMFFLLSIGSMLGTFMVDRNVVEVAMVGSVLLAMAGLASAAAVAVLAWRSRSVAGDAVFSASGGPSSERPLRGRRVAAAAGLAIASVLFFAVFLSLGVSYGVSAGLIMVAVSLITLAGLVVAGILTIRAIWPGQPTSLRTRAFVVIAIAVLIPSVCLALFGVWAFYKSWSTATSLYVGQASYQASEVAREVSSVQRQTDRFSAAERARLSSAIASMYGKQGHLEGAQLATLAQIRDTSTLPRWAIKSLEREGYAIGTTSGPGRSASAEIVAWRVGSNTVRYFVPEWSGTSYYTAPTPAGRLIQLAVVGVVLIIVVGLLGAWLISRSVVGPVQKLAEASSRLAEGEAGVTVKPRGSRELRDLAVSFNDMNAKLTKAQETEQAFLLSVSHELKTPLTSIRGYAEGIGDGTVAPDEGAAVIGVESRRLERLVGDLLESGRMRKSAFTVRSEPVDLVAVAEDVARRYEATARDAGLTLLLDTRVRGNVVADHDRVLQVVSNLIENAVRCTPAPGTVTITTAPGAITVADTGRGLTSDDLPRAFERFYLYSRYGTDRPVGTGLGLAIVKELTEAMGGAVSVSSAVGVGTAFTVALPAGASPQGAPITGGPSPAGVSPAMSASPVAPWSAAPESAAAPDSKASAGSAKVSAPAVRDDAS